MFLQNSYETWSHFLPDDQAYMDLLAKAFEYYEQQRQKGTIQYYGLSTWICFRAPPDEEKMYLNFQKVHELAEQIGGKQHGMKFVQFPMNVLQYEGFVEFWQEFKRPELAEAKKEIMIVVCNLLQMNVIASKPLSAGLLHEPDIPTITNVQDTICKHLQLMRSIPPRCCISTAVGMKTLEHAKMNFNQVLSKPMMTVPEFQRALKMDQ